MKINNLFVAIVTLIAAVYGITACVDGGKFNFGYVSPAVIENNPQAGLFLRTAFGTYVPDDESAVNLLSLSDGSCIYASFDYNSEYQTGNGNYPVASNINYRLIDIDSVREENVDVINDYIYPLLSVELFDESFNLNYKSKFFIKTKAKLGQNQALLYYLYTKSNEQPDTNGVRNLYLQAKLPGIPGSSTNDIVTIRALDMRNMFYSSGKDTTINERGIDYSFKYLRINLKYCSKIENEAPVFESVTKQPFDILILKDDL
jgi:hypothetical protein